MFYKLNLSVQLNRRKSKINRRYEAGSTVAAIVAAVLLFLVGAGAIALVFGINTLVLAAILKVIVLLLHALVPSITNYGFTKLFLFSAFIGLVRFVLGVLFT
jgi:hypothetical protein